MEAEKKRNLIKEGDTIDVYKIGKKLGSGGYGSVYLAYDDSKKRNVALKVSDKRRLAEKLIRKEKNKKIADKIVSQKLADEVATFNYLTVTNKSEYLAEYYDSFQDEHNFYIVMEYVPGKKLDSFSNAEGGKLDKSILWPLMLQLILGVKHIHDLGYTHRDITVDNVLITNNYSVKYIDFGLSCVEKCRYPNCLNLCSSSDQMFDRLSEGETSDLGNNLKEAQLRDVEFLIYSLYDIYLGSIGLKELEKEEEKTRFSNIQQQWSFREKYLNPEFDDGRTSEFLRMIYGKNYSINIILDLFLKNVLAKPWVV